MNGKRMLAALCVCALAVLSACGQGYADPSGSGSGENVGSVASSGSTGNAWESSASGSEDSGTEAARRLAERREYISRYRERICAYGSYTLAAVRDDGTVLCVCADPQYGPDLYGAWLVMAEEVAALRDVASLKQEIFLSGKRTDGSMFFLMQPSNWDLKFKQVETWEDLPDWWFDHKCILGLREDGTVVEDGITKEYAAHAWPEDWLDYDLSGWRDVVDVAMTPTGFDLFGLKSDGTVYYATSSKQSVENEFFAEVPEWTDIVQISVYRYYIAGLQSDGTIVVDGHGGLLDDYIPQVERWTDIVSVSINRSGFMGLKSDGSVVFAGGNESLNSPACESWEDIIAISMGDSYAMGLKSDGSVLSTLPDDPTAGWNIFENRG